MNTKVSFWLIPSPENRAFFQEIINTLAQEYDAPKFTPHVTIYSAEYTPDESLDQLLDKALQNVQCFSLSVDKLLYTDQFTKSLFVQFRPSETLSHISQTLHQNSKIPSDFTLNPHLSLIYQCLNEETKQELAASILLPQSEVFFDEVSAISTPNKTQTREDVESWDVICTRKL